MSDEHVVDPPQADETPPAVVEEAKSLGWVPKDLFKGKETEWVDAGEFVRRGNEVLPIVKENLRRTKEELAKMKAEVSEFKTTAEEFRKFTEEAAERKYKEQMEALKTQYARAVTDGEGEVAAELLDKLSEHRADPPKVTKQTPEPPPLDPDFIKWREANPWYEKDDLQTTAVAIGVRLNAKEGLTGLALYEKVKAEMARAFPEDVTPNDTSARGGMFDEGGTRRGGVTNSKAKTFDNLPSESKAACDRMIKKGFVKTREQYVKNYDWS